MNPKDMILIAVCIVHAGGLAGGMAPEDAQAGAIGFVSHLAQEIASCDEAAAADDKEPN